jgi:hypothetical protein
MPIMDPIRSLWYPIKAFTDTVGTFGPAPFGPVVSHFLQSPFSPGADALVGPVALGIYVPDDNQLQSVLPSFWIRLQQLVGMDGFDFTALGSLPAYDVNTRYRDIAHHVFSCFNSGFPSTDGGS